MLLEQKSGPQAVRWVGHWCSYHILMSSVIYNWTDAQQNGTYLFYTITEKFHFKSKTAIGVGELTRFILSPFHDKGYHDLTQKLNYKTDEWTKGFKIKTSTEKLTSVSFRKLSSSVSCKWKCSVTAIYHFLRHWQTFLQHNFQAVFDGFFPGRLLACLAELNASRCEWYSVACFSWKSSTRAKFFRFVLAQSFENLCLQDLDWLLWTLILHGSHNTQWHHMCIFPLIQT